MIQFDEHIIIFFKWVGSTTNYILNTSIVKQPEGFIFPVFFYSFFFKVSEVVRFHTGFCSPLLFCLKRSGHLASN